MAGLSGLYITYLYRYILLSRRIKKRGNIKKAPKKSGAFFNISM